MSTPESSSDVTDAGMDLWRVQLPTGEVRAMSLDALDDAFQSGAITESTPVLPPGATAWTRLADAAGLEDGAAPPPAESYVPSVAPLAVNIGDSSADARLFNAAPSLPDLDLDEEAAFKPKKTKLFVGIGLAVVLVGGLGFAASRVAATAGSGAMTSSLAAQPATPAAQPPPAAEDPATPGTPGRTLTEEQKAKLAEADKARAAAADKKKLDRPAAPSSPHPRGPREKSGNTFSNGGDKFDPLNGAL